MRKSRDGGYETVSTDELYDGFVMDSPVQEALRRMETREPSFSLINRDFDYYQIGVDFLTNQPIYKLR